MYRYLLAALLVVSLASAECIYAPSTDYKPDPVIVAQLEYAHPLYQQRNRAAHTWVTSLQEALDNCSLDENNTLTVYFWPMPKERCETVTANKSMEALAFQPLEPSDDPPRAKVTMYEGDTMSICLRANSMSSILWQDSDKKLVMPPGLYDADGSWVLSPMT
jgi:hypothetical protein